MNSITTVEILRTETAAVLIYMDGMDHRGAQKEIAEHFEVLDSEWMK